MKEMILKRRAILIVHILMSIIILALSGVLIYYDLESGLIACVLALVFIVVLTIVYFYGLSKLYSELIYSVDYYGKIQKELLEEFEIAYAVLDNKMDIVWTNKLFRKLIKKDKGFHGSISECFPMLTQEVLPTKKGSVAEFEIEIDNRNIRMVLKNGNLSGKNEHIDSYALYLFDETVLKESINELSEQRPVVGLIYIDNYEELMLGIEEVRQSLLLALVERKISKYFSETEGIFKKLDKDKFLVVFRQGALSSLVASRFDLLEDVKTISIGNEIAVTISIGLGLSDTTLIHAGENAGMAMDLALGRGGDQCVIKTDDRINYFGGNTQSIEKSTRVKARVKAHALRELMLGKDRILIMGHQMSDVDSVGAAVGVFRAAASIGKKASIVINIVSTSIQPMMEPFLHNPMYDEDMFLNSEQAIERVDSNTLVVVVDTNRPGYTECPELLKATSHIVVFDHHRRTEDVIENAELSYIEPYASSASEMIAEVLQYFSETVKLKSIEADCLYAGIVIDTNNFTAKTGARTFEAAAYLKRNGADVIRVRKMFRDEIEAYKARAEAISTAEVYFDNYAISICKSEGLRSPTIVGAQAANGLLDINGIKASFVISEFNCKSFISARSIDEVNVQVIMEKLGGGGHLNISGAQLECTVKEAKQKLIRVLEEMIKKGEL